jgi:hypothetical protein
MPQRPRAVCRPWPPVGPSLDENWNGYFGTDESWPATPLPQPQRTQSLRLGSCGSTHFMTGRRGCEITGVVTTPGQHTIGVRARRQ